MFMSIYHTDYPKDFLEALHKVMEMEFKDKIIILGSHARSLKHVKEAQPNALRAQAQGRKWLK